MTSRKKDILVVGSANMDLVVNVRDFPRRGETIFGARFGMFPGGKGANQAVCCAKLGGQTHFIGRIGTDVLGEKLVLNLQRNGVRIDRLIRDDEVPGGIAYISVDRNGQNEIVVVSGSNMRLSPADIEGRGEVFGSAGVLLVQLETPLETVTRSAELAREQGALVILNPAPARRLPLHLLRLVDVLTPNEIEAEMLSGVKVRNLDSAAKAGAALHRKGVKAVVVTLGRKGSLLVTNCGAKRFPAVKVKAVDTTAAGDAFSGGLAVALAEGKPLEEAILFAAKVAAISVTRVGAQGSMPTRAEVE